MCGLFGFFGTEPEWAILDNAAVLSARRGPDAWGVFDGKEVLRNLGRLQGLRTFNDPGPIVMGHCRLATVLGTTRDIGAVQPFARDGLVLAHNGAVYNLARLVEGGLRLRTASDSEAWLGLMLEIGGGLVERFKYAQAQIDHHGYFAIAVHSQQGGEILLASREMPLFVLNRCEGIYWSSVDPGGWRRISEVEVYARSRQKNRAVRQCAGSFEEAVC